MGRSVPVPGANATANEAPIHPTSLQISIASK
jgi:hypothetical protein